ncbi:hypothetical protein CDAR_52241 [Caerostris darwini]|uniref:Uncharacterized protein n=1 Tax=Caerostris darwini TaxID=1538125 RepID=A0AAV4V3S1_9ARAC|nr:hypothetical protein CDAR_52241 [Caerostris darwini]
MNRPNDPCGELRLFTESDNSAASKQSLAIQYCPKPNLNEQTQLPLGELRHFTESDNSAASKAIESLLIHSTAS